MDSTSESLLIRLRSPIDQEAWSRFVGLYTPLIFYWAHQTGMQTNDAADLVQDVLSIAFQKLPTFEYQRNGSFRGWLRTVTLNKRREHLRRNTVNALRGKDSALAQVADPSARETWDLQYRQALVARAMELLRDQFQPTTWQALTQYAIHGRPAQEVADEFKLSVWTIYAAKARLMKKLRLELEGLL